MFLDNLFSKIKCNRARRISRKQQTRQEPLHEIRIGVAIGATGSRTGRDDNWPTSRYKFNRCIQLPSDHPRNDSELVWAALGSFTEYNRQYCRLGQACFWSSIPSPFITIVS